MRKLNDVPKERERVKGKGERRSGRKEKKKEKLQPWLEKFQLISMWESMMIPLHTTTGHEIGCGNKSKDSIFDCLI